MQSQRCDLFAKTIHQLFRVSVSMKDVTGIPISCFFTLSEYHLTCLA